MNFNEWPDINRSLQTDTDEDPKALKLSIETFFSDYFGHRALLLPSGRSALSAILKCEGINRSHIAYAPQWSSFCVWSILGRYCNPTVLFSSEVNVVLNVNKWGHRFTPKKEASFQLWIEDSVDTLYKKRPILFHNNAQYEFFSLPKTIGSLSGAILFCRDDDKANQIASLRSENNEIVKEQEKTKLHFGQTLHGPNSLEWKNFELTPTLLKNITQNLPRYELNLTLCSERLRYLATQNHIASTFSQDQDRIPMVIPLEEDQTSLKVDQLPKRHFCLERETFSTKHREVRALPLHSSISEDQFKKLF